MRAGQEDGPDPGPGKARELGRDALDGPAWLGVGIEEVADDQEEVDPLGDGQVNRGAERLELALALGGRLLSEIRMPCPEVDIGRV